MLLLNGNFYYVSKNMMICGVLSNFKFDMKGKKNFYVN